MNKKEHLINKINSFEEKYFNEDQKKIAVKILENAPEKEVQAYADFIFMKRRTGFAFDYSPEIAKGRLITLREDEKRRVNVDDEINNDENKLIIGDNYNALKALLITHKNKIDVIYIDPPYNTESAKLDGNQSSKEEIISKFVYKDKFGRGGWLNMMKARLTLAKDLLTNQGVIFISIDDSEQAYIKVLMDDIFGEKNFYANLPRRSGTSKNKGGISKEHDYILVYSFKKDLFQIDKNDNLKSNTSKKYKNKDNKGTYRLKETTSQHGYNKKNDYDILFNNKIFKLNKSKNGIKQSWGWKKETFLQKIKNNEIVEKNNKLYRKIYLNTRPLPSFLFEDKKFSTESGTKNLKKLNINFPNPKTCELIKTLINWASNYKNSIILDFFAGSGTTGQAVMELNKEDDGNRKFILCTNNENNIAHDITYERLHRVIIGKTFKNSNKDFDWLKNNKPFKNEKLRVIDIDDKINISLNNVVEQKIYNDAKNGLKLLDLKYNKKELNLYYDLAALNPLKNEYDKFDKK